MSDRDVWYHDEPREGRPFHRVQRLIRSPYKKPAEDASPLAKATTNPFGYGRMGDYELDYMGAAEFEFGSIPLANNRLAAAGKGLVLDEWSYGGYDFDFLWIEKEGEPYEAWMRWAEGDPPFDGKEPPYELRERLDGKEPRREEWRTAIWWALDANVLWALKEDGHLHRWMESLGTAPTEFIR